MEEVSTEPGGHAQPIGYHETAVQHPSVIGAFATGTTPTAGMHEVATGPAAGITAEQASALASVIPPHVAANPEALTEHLKLLQQLVQMGVPKEQWNLVATALEEQKITRSAVQNVGGVNRARSRSPNRRRNSPVYGTYDERSTYRQRSPPQGGSMFVGAEKINTTDQPRWVEFDPTIPKGSIKVLSRTLFVGGATCGEDEIRGIFSRFGRVQTCIANAEKRHAFVKMESRADAVRAKDGMESNRDADVLMRIRSTRWGVGFGPRDCSDYTTGVSVIPIDRLTDADRKWVVTAPFGGTGGKSIDSGMAMEEPDIEIGAGVSSKAISARGGPSTHRSGGLRGSRPFHDLGRGSDRASYTPPQQAQFGGQHSQPLDSNAVGLSPATSGYDFKFSGISTAGIGSMNSMQTY